MNPAERPDSQKSREEHAAGEALRRIPAQQAPAVRTDIGTALRSARLQKGYALEAVAQQTRIPKRYLEALEHNRLEEFPALVYLRGFLKGYCDYLELDFEPLWRSLSSETAPEGGGGQEPAPGAGSQQPPSPMIPKPGKSSLVSSQSPGNPAAVVALALVLAALLVLGISRSGRPIPKNRIPAPPAALQPLASRIEPVVVLVTRDDLWLSLSLDGATRFEGLIPKGVRQEWKARGQLALKTNNPSALSLYLNGAPLELPAPDPAGLYRIESP